MAAKKLANYRDATWATRPCPHVDRLACAWLIRRFINPTAEIRYATRSESGEVGFDMREAEFGHQGNCCTFETMMSASGLKEAGLQGLVEIVHEIDLRDGRYARPERLFETSDMYFNVYCIAPGPQIRYIGTRFQTRFCISWKVNLVVGGLLEILKAIQRGMVIAASLKL